MGQPNFKPGNRLLRQMVEMLDGMRLLKVTFVTIANRAFDFRGCDLMDH